jgi:PST family polysaccharide transporter
MERLKNILKTKTAKDTSVLFLGNTVASLLAVIFVVLSARYLGPDSWGVVAAIISLVVIAEAVGDLGLGSSLFRFVSKDWAEGRKAEAESTLSTVFAVRLISSSALLLLIAALAPFLSELLKINSTTYILIAAFSIFGYLLLDFQILAFEAKHKWAAASLFTVIPNALRLLIVIWMVSRGNLSATSVLVAFAVSPVVALVGSFFMSPPKITFKFSHKIGQIFRFSGWLGLNRIAAAGGSRIDAILLLSLLGEYQTGIFSAAKQLSIGVPLIAGSIATVLAPRFASLKGEGLVSYFKKTILLSFGVALLTFMGIFLTPFIVRLLGSEYQPSVSILQWLLVGYVPFVLSIPAVNILIYAYGKSRIIAALSYSNLLL